MSAAASTLLDEGGNYRLTHEGDVVVATVFRREGLTSAEGAECAERMVRSIDAALGRSDVAALVLDLFAAPPVMGPRTLVAIEDIVRRGVERRRKVRVVAGSSATGRLQLERLVRAHGVEARVVPTIEEARATLAR